MRTLAAPMPAREGVLGVFIAMEISTRGFLKMLMRAVVGIHRTGISDEK